MKFGRFSQATGLGRQLKPSALGLAVIVAAFALLEGSGGLFRGADPAWRSPTGRAAQGSLFLLPASSLKAPGQSGLAQRAQLLETLRDLPLSFEPNTGQTDKRVKFLSRGRGYTLFLTANEAVLALGAPSQKSDSRSRKGNSSAPSVNPRFQDATDRGLRSAGGVPVLHMKLEGANPAPKVVAGERLPGRSNYFIGNNPSEWRTHIAHYAQVRYEQVYPGVNLVYYGNQQQLEYDFALAPGAHPDTIRLAVGTGLLPAQGSLLRIEDGDLIVKAGSAEVRFHKPVAYQPRTSRGQLQPATVHRPQTTDKQYVDARYVLRGRDTIGFEIASYDPSRPLIIDPVLSYSTYLGGTADDSGYGIAVDSSGNAYVTGSTGSIDFPTQAPEQTANGGSVDAFVAKVQADGAAFVYSTYLGGNAFDTGTGISVDSSGNAYIVGYTSSTNLPTTTGAAQTGYGGGQSDAFVVKLNADGSALTYATYLGGSDADYGRAIALDSSGDAFITGDTQSADFPTASPLQAALAGSSDAFVAELNAAGSSLVYSTYLGGGNADVGEGIALDSSGNAYVVGYTFSTDFKTASPLQSSLAGGSDAFVAKLNSAGSALVYSTYFGGSGMDRALAVAVDSSGNAYITGDTTSSNLPTTAGALSTTYHGNGDAFFAKLNAAGSGLSYSSYLGGVDADSATGIAVNSSGNIYLVGSTRSNNFPLASAFQDTFGGGTCGGNSCYDAFVAEVDAGGGSLVYSSYLGGSGNDFGQAIALDSGGNAYLTGATASSNFPATGGVPQPAYSGTGGNGDAFVVKVGSANAAGLSLLPQSLVFGDQATGTTSTAQTVTLMNVGTATLSISSVTASSGFGVTNHCGNSLAPGGASCTLDVAFTPSATGSATGTVTISDSAAGSPHTINLTGNGVAPGAAVTLSVTTLDFGTVTVGQSSSAQSVTVTNSGSATLQITAVATTASDYTETDTCVGKDIAVGGSCSVAVTFKPVSTGTSGTIAAGLTITDNATGSPQSVSLTGVAAAEFSIASNITSSTQDRGTDSATYTISAASPSGYAQDINLSCSNNPSIICTFNPTTIKVGSTSTLTVTGLSSVAGNTTTFTVTGASTNASSNTEGASVTITILLGDFTISASPPLSSVAAGNSTTYTLTLAPVNQFSGALTVACSSVPKETSCAFDPSSPSLNGSSPLTVTVTVKTTSRSKAITDPGQRLKLPPPGGPMNIPWFVWLTFLAALTAMMALVRWRRQVWFGRVASLAGLVLVVALWAGCDTYYYNPISSANLPGTPAGTYTFAISATFKPTTGTPLTHGTTVNLTVS